MSQNLLEVGDIVRLRDEKSESWLGVVVHKYAKEEAVEVRWPMQIGGGRNWSILWCGDVELVERAQKVENKS